MKLHIDPTKNNSTKIEVTLYLKDKTESIEVSAKRQQAEKLLPTIDYLLKKTETRIDQLKVISVVNQGSSFSALRIGVATANALGYALMVPVEEHPSTSSLQKGGQAGQGDKEIRQKHIKNTKEFYIVKPKYDKEPCITEKKNTL